eukprot:g222.t1
MIGLALVVDAPSGSAKLVYRHPYHERSRSRKSRKRFLERRRAKGYDAVTSSSQDFLSSTVSSTTTTTTASNSSTTNNYAISETPFSVYKSQSKKMYDKFFNTNRTAPLIQADEDGNPNSIPSASYARLSASDQFQYLVRDETAQEFADLFRPRAPALCNRLFEITIDRLRFISFPTLFIDDTDTTSTSGEELIKKTNETDDPDVHMNRKRYDIHSDNEDTSIHSLGNKKKRMEKHKEVTDPPQGKAEEKGFENDDESNDFVSFRSNNDKPDDLISDSDDWLVHKLSKELSTLFTDTLVMDSQSSFVAARRERSLSSSFTAAASGNSSVTTTLPTLPTPGNTETNTETSTEKMSTETSTKTSPETSVEEERIILDKLGISTKATFCNVIIAIDRHKPSTTDDILHAYRKILSDLSMAIAEQERKYYFVSLATKEMIQRARERAKRRKRAMEEAKRIREKEQILQKLKEKEMRRRMGIIDDDENAASVIPSTASVQVTTNPALNVINATIGQVATPQDIIGTTREMKQNEERNDKVDGKNSSHTGEKTFTAVRAVQVSMVEEERISNTSAGNSIPTTTAATGAATTGNKASTVVSSNTTVVLNDEQSETGEGSTTVTEPTMNAAFDGDDDDVRQRQNNKGEGMKKPHYFLNGGLYRNVALHQGTKITVTAQTKKVQSKLKVNANDLPKNVKSSPLSSELVDAKEKIHLDNDDVGDEEMIGLDSNLSFAEKKIHFISILRKFYDGLSQSKMVDLHFPSMPILGGGFQKESFVTTSSLISTAADNYSSSKLRLSLYTPRLLSKTAMMSLRAVSLEKENDERMKNQICDDGIINVDDEINKAHNAMVHKMHDNNGSGNKILLPNVRPYQTLLLIGDGIHDSDPVGSILDFIDRSPELWKVFNKDYLTIFLQRVSPLKCFAELALESIYTHCIPLPTIMAMAQHLVLWGKAKLIDTIHHESVLSIAPKAKVGINQISARDFRKRWGGTTGKKTNSFILPLFLSQFSGTWKTFSEHVNAIIEENDERAEEKKQGNVGENPSTFVNVEDRRTLSK